MRSSCSCPNCRYTLARARSTCGGGTSALRINFVYLIICEFLVRICFAQTVRKILQTIVCQAIPEQIKPFAAVILVEKKAAYIHPPILHRGQPGISVTAKMHLQPSPITQFPDVNLEPEPPALAFHPAPRRPQLPRRSPPGAAHRLSQWTAAPCFRGWRHSSAFFGLSAA